MNAIPQASRPAGRRIPSMERQIDQLGDSISVEPDWGAVVELVFQRANGIPEHPGHFI